MIQKIEILGMKIIQKKGLLATANIKIDSFIFNQFRLLQNSKGEMFVDVPLLHWLTRGQHFYEPAIELSEELLNNIEEKIIDEFERRISQHKD